MDAVAQFADGRLFVFLARRVFGGQSERRVLGVIAKALNLADEGPHVRAQPHGEIAVRIELARLRMLLRLIENGEECVEPALVDRHAALIERKGHWLQFPPKFGRTSPPQAMDAPKV